MFRRHSSKNSDDRGNPIEMMAFEADAVNLLGEGAGDTDKSGDEQRISHEEAQAICTRLVAQVAPHVDEVEHPPLFEGQKPIKVLTAVLPDELSGSIRDSISDGVARIADGTLSGHELSRFSVVTRFFNSGWYQEDGRHVDIQGNTPLFGPTIRAATNLTYATAMLEGNLPPNYLGYRADEPVSLVGKYEIVKEELERAAHDSQAVLWTGPEGAAVSLFGDLQTTTQVFNGIVDRAEMHRPTFMGTVVGDPFPRI